jgi:hypothetical protein
MPGEVSKMQWISAVFQIFAYKIPGCWSLEILMVNVVEKHDQGLEEWDTFSLHG